VLDPLSGYLMVAARMAGEPKRFAGAWNFGPDAASVHTVKEMADAIVGRWGSGSVVVQTEANAPHEASLLHLSTDKARQCLGWEPRWGFEDTVVRTARWYLAQHNAEAIDRLSREQISDYVEGNPRFS
jgi:CDP-glucose 4,6-dehydratase